MRPLLTRRQPPKEKSPNLPPEIVEKILMGADARTLVKARTLGRPWVRFVDKQFVDFKVIYIDVMRVELAAGNKLIIHFEAEPFKFAYILPLLRWFDTGEGRSISVIHLKD
ncbi:hypothetical protein PRIPAC_94304, partial [Pristionchus pacificus]